MIVRRLYAPSRAAVSSSQLCLSNCAPHNTALDLLRAALASSQTPSLTQVRHATHGTSGVANGPKNGPGKRLGAKKTGEQYVIPGNIIFRQRGTKWFPGENCDMGRDHTIYATQPGFVKYYKDPQTHPKRQYIGVALQREWNLPTPPNAPRRRRLGMLAVPTGQTDQAVESDIRDEEGRKVVDGLQIPDDPEEATTIREVPRSDGRRWPWEDPNQKVRNTGGLKLKGGYMYRVANWEIGKAQDTSTVKIPDEQKYMVGPRARFLAWKKKGIRVAKNAERRGMKSGKKAVKKQKK